MDKLQRAAQAIKNADGVLVGISSGFAEAEGLHLYAADKEFQHHFGDFQKKYGIGNLSQGMNYPWPNEQAKWQFWCRLIDLYYNQYSPSTLMKDLKDLVGYQDHFIMTTNGDGHLEKAGFFPKNLDEIEGNWLTMQCSRACHEELYPTPPLVDKLLAASSPDGTLPQELLPRCPRCGAPMQVHMNRDEYFIPNTSGSLGLSRFIHNFSGTRLVILELGIGWQDQLLKGPLMQLAQNEDKAVYIAINQGEIFLPPALADKSISLDGALGDILSQLCFAL